MKRSDLKTGQHLDPGIYLLEGDEGDPNARVVQGPFPNNEEGKRTATILGEQLSARTRQPHCLVAVIDLPR